MRSCTSLTGAADVTVVIEPSLAQRRPARAGRTSADASTLPHSNNTERSVGSRGSRGSRIAPGTGWAGYRPPSPDHGTFDLLPATGRSVASGTTTGPAPATDGPQPSRTEPLSDPAPR